MDSPSNNLMNIQNEPSDQKLLSSVDSGGSPQTPGRTDAQQLETARETVGRTPWDIVGKFATPILLCFVGLVSLLLIGTLIGTWLDLVDVNNNEGWHFRLGVNHREIELRAKQVEETEQESHNLLFRQYLASFLVGKWAGGWKVERDYSLSDSSFKCTWDKSTSMVLHVKSYDPILNRGEGEAELHVDVHSALVPFVSRAVRQSQACNERASAQDGKERTQLYHVFFSSDNRWGIRARFIERECGSICADMQQSFVALPTHQLDYIVDGDGHVRMSRAD